MYIHVSSRSLPFVFVKCADEHYFELNWNNWITHPVSHELYDVFAYP